MFLKQSAFGLDLSDVSIKLALLEKEKGGIILTSYNRQEIPENVIEEGEIKKEDILIATIKQALAQTKGKPIKTRRCVVSLPETESFIRMVQLPKMKKEEIDEAIKWEAEANIPLSYEEIYLDWQIIKPPTNHQKQYDILIGALPKKLVDDYLTLLEKAELQPVVFEIESVATARALIENGLSIKPILIIDLGAKKTSFAIFSGRAIHFTASLPVSNISLIKTIAKNLNVDFATAKKLKFEIGLDKKTKKGKVFEALGPPLLELVKKIQEYIEFYNTHVPIKHTLDGQINKVLLCGGGANLAGLPSFLSKQLQLDVEVGNPWVNILKPPIKKIPEIPYEESIAFTTALGLALRGINL